MDVLAKQKLVVVLGPTASGKTALSIKLAQRYGGEIISADSMQIYRGLDVGTAKATKQERALVPHHLVDIADPEQSFSVAAFLPLAKQAIAEISARGHLPIVCGGTGLYLSSLVNGITFTEENGDSTVRESLRRQCAQRGAAAMLQQLAGVDPVYAAKLHENDEKRILRALELYEKTGLTMSEQLARSRPAEPPYQTLLLGLAWPDRQTLYDRINLRVEQMAADGLLPEARLVYDHKESWKTAAQAIGYKEFFPYLEGKESLPEAVAALQQATRNYAKRQLSWFRRMEGVVWLPAQAPNAQAEAFMEQFLQGDSCAGREQ